MASLVVSADSHVMESATLWTERLGRKFQDRAPLTCRYFGEDQFMWASDFPHTDSTWPRSQEVIARDVAHVSESVRRKIVCDNAVKLYRMDLN